jgi:hypothetical protein
MEEIILCQEITPKRIRVYPNCEHEKKKRHCKICNPKAFCYHNRAKQICKECNGASICIHNKRKMLCNICSPHLWCQHNRLKCKCKDCGSINYCQHNIRKETCKDCDGKSICIHNKNKTRCILCSPHLCCSHNKIKSRCKICNPNCSCEHNIEKYKCKICNINIVCIHNKIKYNCLECGSNNFCQHNNYKAFCKLCKGVGICLHGNNKYNCLDCGGSNLCINCKLSYKNKKYNNNCLRCFIYLFPDQPVTRNYKTKETSVAQFITNNFPNFTWNLDKKIEEGCSKRRPDLMCDLGYQVIIVEIDENMHENYDCSCENKRIMQLSQDVGHKPIIFIRFNPDAYINLNNEKVTSCWGTTPKTGILKIKNNKNDEWNNRLSSLKSQIEYWTDENNKTEKTIEIVQLFYNSNINDF